jgi:hypothetical protein
VIRPLTPDDLDTALAVNQGCVPEVGPLDAPGLALLVEWSPFGTYRVALLEKRLSPAAQS